MGVYLNPDNENFFQAINSKIYVDKTGLIGFTNQVMRTLGKYICVSRPRRFGKSMAANTLQAIWSRRASRVVELNWDKTAEGAIAQIKKKQYCRSLEDYRGNLLLVGINYDKETREHTCVIEEYEK